MDQGGQKFMVWKEQIPASIRSEKYWALIAYQKALFQYDLLWQDTQIWLKDIRGQPLVRQIIGSADSICANIEEGFGRGYGKQLIQFYVYSLGSARETKGRLYRARAFYTEDTLQSRLDLASEVVALLLTEINRQKYRQ
jgi:four helix bundle protein